MSGSSESYQLRTKTVLVTGGSSGIGMATATLLQKNGYGTVSISRTGDCAAGSLGIQCDIGDPAQIEVLPQKLRQLGINRLSGLFLAAGGGGFSKLSDVVSLDVDRIYKVDFRGSLLCLRELTCLLESDSAIIFCSSAVARLARAEVSYYGALKAGIEALTLSLAAELGPRIRVNCVAPGAIKTPIYQKLGLDLKSIEDDVARGVPLARMGNPEEVAEVVEFLISPRASYVSGAVIPVHGGGLPNR